MTNTSPEMTRPASAVSRHDANYRSLDVSEGAGLAGSAPPESEMLLTEEEAKFGLPDKPYIGFCGLAGKP